MVSGLEWIWKRSLSTGRTQGHHWSPVPGELTRNFFFFTRCKRYLLLPRLFRVAQASALGSDTRHTFLINILRPSLTLNEEKKETNISHIACNAVVVYQHICWWGYTKWCHRVPEQCWVSELAYEAICRQHLLHKTNSKVLLTYFIR